MKLNPKPNGFLVINKPKHMSSRQLVSKVSKQLGVKAGHTGTLDPLATGMMVLSLSDATKFSQWITSKDKAYLASIQFGQQTSTDDLEGEVINASSKKINLDDINKIIPSYVGSIDQIPPQFSAIHHEGTRSYLNARKGVHVNLKARNIYIHSIEIKSFNYESQQIELYIHCQSGTYIRSIARDMGNQLGCYGHLTKLDRLWVSPFKASDIHQVEDINTANIISLESFFSQHPNIELTHQQAVNLAHGKTIQIDTQGERAAFYNGHFLGIIIPTNQGTYKSQRLRANIIEYLQHLG